MQELLQGERVDGGVDTRLADEEVVVDDRHVVLGKLHVEFDVLGT